MIGGFFLHCSKTPVSLPCPEYLVQTDNATRVGGERKRQRAGPNSHINVENQPGTEPECLTQISATAQRILTLGPSGAISKGKELCWPMQMAEVTAAKISLC